VAIEQQLCARGVDFLLVTQNIDTLHEQAGSRALIKVHGSSASVRCSKTGCRHGAPGGFLPRSDQDFSAFLASGEAKDLPRCPACSSLLRPHLLWFDERYAEHRSYDVDRALRAAKQARVMLFVGTSFSVGITAALLKYGVARAKVYSIDPGGLKPHRRVEVIQIASEIALPMLAEAPGNQESSR
jgi:NAD-dependent deacetylase